MSAAPPQHQQLPQPLRVGLVGTGYWARETHAPGITAAAGAELVAVWGRDPVAAAGLAQAHGATAYHDVADLLADVDAVSFSVPPDVQADLADGGRAGRQAPAAGEADRARPRLGRSPARRGPGQRRRRAGVLHPPVRPRRALLARPGARHRAVVGRARRLAGFRALRRQPVQHAMAPGARWALGRRPARRRRPVAHARTRHGRSRRLGRARPDIPGPAPRRRRHQHRDPDHHGTRRGRRLRAAAVGAGWAHRTAHRSRSTPARP